MRVVTLLVVLLFPVTAIAQVAAIEEIISSRVTVFEKHDGGAKVAVLKRGDVKLPAAQLSNPSEYGLIQVELQYADGSKPPVIGWIKQSSVETSTKREIDVISDCGKSLAAGNGVSRGTRGLGGC